MLVVMALVVVVVLFLGDGGGKSAEGSTGSTGGGDGGGAGGTGGVSAAINKVSADIDVGSACSPTPKKLQTPWKIWEKNPAIRDWVESLSVKGTASTDVEFWDMIEQNQGAIRPIGKWNRRTWFTIMREGFIPAEESQCWTHKPERSMFKCNKNFTSEVLTACMTSLVGEQFWRKMPGTDVVGMECLCDKFNKTCDKFILWWVNPGNIDVHATTAMIRDIINKHLSKIMLMKA